MLEQKIEQLCESWGITDSEMVAYLDFRGVGPKAATERIIAHIEQQMDESDYDADYRALADLLAWLREGT